MVGDASDLSLPYVSRAERADGRRWRHGRRRWRRRAAAIHVDQERTSRASITATCAADSALTVGSIYTQTKVRLLRNFECEASVVVRSNGKRQREDSGDTLRVSATPFPVSGASRLPHRRADMAWTGAFLLTWVSLAMLADPPAVRAITRAEKRHYKYVCM